MSVDNDKDAKVCLGVYINGLLEMRRQLDPDEHTPVYDLHRTDGRSTGYCLVQVEWLDRMYAGAIAAGVADGMMPHDHLSPEDWETPS